VDFTREPIIETVITPKEGFKLAIRSSKNPGHEEFFVEAVEVVSFGSSLFFRSLERPKAFIVPVSDYEVLEVRETRLVLKNVGIDRSIKIAGGREGALKLPPRESTQEKGSSEGSTAEESSKAPQDAKGDRKRDRRRQNRRRRGRDEIIEGETEETGELKEMEPVPADAQVKVKLPLSRPAGDPSQEGAPPTLSTLLPPPPMLISETMAQYRNNALFKEAFFLKDEEQQTEAVQDESQPEEACQHQPHPEQECEAPCSEHVEVSPQVEHQPEEHKEAPQE
jgi:hypothetical protein